MNHPSKIVVTYWKIEKKNSKPKTCSSFGNLKKKDSEAFLPFTLGSLECSRPEKMDLFIDIS